MAWLMAYRGGKPSVLGLLETLGMALQAQGCFAQLFEVGRRQPLSLQALPDFQDLPCLMNDPLGKVLLEALVTGIGWLGHVLTTFLSWYACSSGSMLALLIEQARDLPLPYRWITNIQLLTHWSLMRTRVLAL